MKKTAQNKTGFALASVLSIIMVLSLAFGAFFASSQHQAFVGKKLINRTKALAYAEAGIDYAFSKLSADFTLREDISVFGLDGSTMVGDGIESTFGEGSFTISIDPRSNRYCIVTSVGKCGGQTVTAEIVSEDYNAGTGSTTTVPRDYTGMPGFDFPILSGGNFNSNGNVTILGSSGNAKIHCNGDMDLTKKQADNAANTMTTTGSFTKKPAANGSSGAPSVPVPPIDLTPWENEAIKNGMVIDVNDPIPSPIVGGILIVTGQGTLQIKSDIQATIIVVEADISVDANTTPGPGYTLGLVTKEGGGDIILNGNGSITGLSYTGSGDFITHGTPEVHGQLLVNGSTTIGGTVDAFLFSKSILTPPGTDEITSPYVQDVRIGAWQQ